MIFYTRYAHTHAHVEREKEKEREREKEDRERHHTVCCVKEIEKIPFVFGEHNCS